MARTTAIGVLAYRVGVDEPWAVITDESPTLQTLWQYALRFQIEELFQGQQEECVSVGRLWLA